MDTGEELFDCATEIVYDHGPGNSVQVTVEDMEELAADALPDIVATHVTTETLMEEEERQRQELREIEAMMAAAAMLPPAITKEEDQQQ